MKYFLNFKIMLPIPPTTLAYPFYYNIAYLHVNRSPMLVLKIKDTVKSISKLQISPPP